MTSTVDAHAWTITSLLAWSQDYLSRNGIDEARLTAELLLCHVLACKRIDLYLKFDMILSDAELARYKELFRRRLGREPLQYIVGETEFMGLTLAVDRRVLIPRPETEALVEAVLERAATFVGPRILDIGTGSGNIAIALACRLTGSSVVAADASREALEVARANALRHRCGDRVTLVHADIRTAPAAALGAPFAIVVSNPPYVPAHEYAGLEPEVRDHEPKQAMTDGGDGLLFHRAIAERGRSLLVPGGFLALEVGYGQAGSVQELCRTAGYDPVEVLKDLAGIERIVIASWKG